MSLSTELSVTLGFGLGAFTALVVTPLAMRVAIRTAFLDRPRGYRAHKAPTPFLGGAAVLIAFLAATAAVGGLRKNEVVVLCTLAIWGIGTIDDRYAVPPRWRLLAEAAAATTLFSNHMGWNVTGSAALNLALTVVWCVGLVNAFNLMDNLDGACGTVGGVSAVGVGCLAVVHDNAIAAGMAFGLAGACAGFLRYNLARPARIFLGDGGSMTIGFLIAALGMGVGRHLNIGSAGFLAVALTAGVVILDTTLVSVSRTRRGVSVLTGGRDHLSHRLLGRLGTPHLVAATLAAGQASLSLVAIAGERIGSGAEVGFASAAAALGVAAIAVLDGPRWRPAGIATRAGPSAPVPAALQPDLAANVPSSSELQPASRS